MASPNLTTVHRPFRQDSKKQSFEDEWIIYEFEKCFWEIQWDKPSDRWEGRTINLTSGDQVKPYLFKEGSMVKVGVDYLHEVYDDSSRMPTFKAMVVKSDKVVASVEGQVSEVGCSNPKNFFTRYHLPCSDDGSVNIIFSIDVLTFTDMDNEYDGPEMKDLLQFAHLAAKNGELTDFDLICGSAVFPVHRIYLAQSSDVFRMIYLYEPQKTQADLSTHSASDVAKLLEYVYTNDLADQESFNSTSLLKLADEYNVVGLRLRCERSLASKLTPENAVEMKSLAQGVYAPFLLKKTEAFLNAI